MKTQDDRNAMGQFSTPINLAKDILRSSKNLLPQNSKIRFFDPAFGTGAFFSALNTVFPDERIETAKGFEIDQHYGLPACNLWSVTQLDLQLIDFTTAVPPSDNKENFNLLICNPPYVRHHHINGIKKRLHSEALKSANMDLSGLAGLYCYFIALSHRWISKNGLSVWLVPSEFMDVNYGYSVKLYLLQSVTLLRIHRFNPNDVQFNDALVSSSVIWFKNIKPSKEHKVKFTYGGDINKPEIVKLIDRKILFKEAKWTRFPLYGERERGSEPRIKDFFTVKRGIATGNNRFFVLTSKEIKEKKLPIEQFRPILQSPRYLNYTVIDSDEFGNPTIDNPLFVLDCRLPLNQIQEIYPNLYQYLQEGIGLKVHERYLCKNRNIWYSQENRSESLYYCTYIGRTNKDNKNPFRFILNNSKAIVLNSYLMLYPKPLLNLVIQKNPEFRYHILYALQKITGKAMLDEGRVYGGGMHKLEPKELSNVQAVEIANLLTKFKKIRTFVHSPSGIQQELNWKFSTEKVSLNKNNNLTQK